MTCNIPSSNKDPQYRYKMPKIVTKIEGRGIGIKTSVVNMGDVARALKCPPQYTTKWLGIELGAMSNYSNKKGQGERAIVNGSHEASAFQSLLDKYIEKYICCSNCKLPELDMRVKKNDITAKCKACGWSGDLDSGHRLAAFIRNNPPDASGMNVAVEENDGGDKKAARRAAKLAKQQGGQDDGDGDDDDDVSDDVDESKDEKKKKKKKKKKDADDDSDADKKKKKKKKKKKDDDDSDSDADKKKKKKKKKKDADDSDSDADKKKKKKKKKKKDDDDDDKKKKDKKDKKKKKDKKAESDSSESEAEEIKNMEWDDEQIPKCISDLSAFLKKTSDPLEFFQEARMYQASNIFDDKVRLYVVASAVFEDKMEAAKVTAKKAYIEQVIKKSKAGVLDGKVVLWAFNACLSKQLENKKAFPMVLKAVYDADWVTDKTILSYYNDDEGEDEPGFADAKAVSKPFLEWLAQSDSESSSGSDDESDDSSSS